MRNKHGEPAYTLVELLVCIAIVSVLLGLLLPAIQKARAAVQRTTCEHNLRQIGIALHGYHDSHQAFPSGVQGPLSRPYPFMSWNAAILPYLEQDNLWDSIRGAYLRDPDFLHIPPHVHRGTVVRAFACPADPRSLSPAGDFLPVEIAFTSYLGIEGTDYRQMNGVLFVDSAIRMSEIVDGTSNTLLVGERPPSADEKLGWWYAGWGQSQDGSAEMVLGVSELNVSYPECFRGPYRFGQGRIGNQCDCFHFWSLHSGGGHFSLVDGSVHFLSYSAHAMMPALATRSGGETAELP